MFVLNSLKIICGVTWKIDGLKNIPEGPCVIVSNHQSAWESFFLQTLCIPSASIIKKELLFIPFFGWALACLKPIHLRRSKKYRAHDDNNAHKLGDIVKIRETVPISKTKRWEVIK